MSVFAACDASAKHALIADKLNVALIDVNLLNPSGAVIADGQGVGTIIDNDLPPSIDIEAAGDRSTFLVFALATRRWSEEAGQARAGDCCVAASDLL